MMLRRALAPPSLCGLLLLALLLGLSVGASDAQGAALLRSPGLATGSSGGSDRATLARGPVAPTTLTGWFSVLWGDEANGAGFGAEVYTLAEDTGETTQLKLDPWQAEAAGGIMALNRRRVIVVGSRTGLKAPSGSEEFEVSWIRPAPSEAGAAAVEAIVGPQPWVSILCKFSDVAAAPHALSYFTGMYSSAYPGLDHYWREQSFNLANVSGSSAYGWFTLPYSRSHYVYDNDADGVVELDFTRSSNDCTGAAVTFGVYFPSYVGINMMFNSDLDNYAWGGSRYMTLNGVPKLYSVTWEPPWGYANSAVIAHEMGHGFGLPHSSGAYGQTYDNQWDVMSDTWSNCSVTSDTTYGCIGQHTISYHKSLLGWITATQFYAAAAYTQTISIEQLAQPQTGNYLGARLPIGDSTTHYYTVEARRKVGYDLKLPGEAVIIHDVDTTRNISARVIDIDGNGNTGDAGARWIVGESFVDSANSITVSVMATTTSGFVVALSFKPAPAPIAPADGMSLPAGTVTFTWSAVGGATGYELQLDASPTFTSTGLVDLTPSGTSVTRSLGTLGRYYWRVRALPGGRYSLPWRFTIAGPLVQATASSSDLSAALVQASDGRLWLFSRLQRGGGEAELWAQRSTNGGATWGSAAAFTASGFDDDSPAAAVTSSGRLVVAWRRGAGSPGIWHASSADNGTTWSAPAQLASSSGRDRNPAVAYGAGALWVFWDSDRSGNDDIWYRKSTDSGSTWSVPAQLTSGALADTAPAASLAADGKLWVVWVRGDRLWYRTTSDGSSWSAEAQVDGTCCYDRPALSRDSDGTLWLASERGSDIWMLSSGDGGRSWWPAVQWTRFTGDDFRPALARLSDGHVAAAWDSDRGQQWSSNVWFGVIGVREDISPPPFAGWLNANPAWPLSSGPITLSVMSTDDGRPPGVELVWTRDGAAQTDLAMFDDGTHGDFAGGDSRYSVQVGAFPAGTTVQYQARAADSAGNAVLHPQSPHSFKVAVPFTVTRDVLFLPDDGGNDTGWFRSHFTASLDTLGYRYDVWDTGLRGPVQIGLLDSYTGGTVIWAVPRSGFLTSDSGQVALLQAYLDAGGKLFLTGQDLGEQLETGGAGSAFLHDYVHADFLQGNTGLSRLAGVTGDPIGGGLMIDIGGGTGAGNQDSTDEVNPLLPAQPAFIYQPGTLAAGRDQQVPEGGASARPVQLTVPAGNVGSGTAGLRVMADGYGLVFFAFGFEGINTSSDRSTVLGRVLDWLGACKAVVTPASLAIRRSGADLALTWAGTDADAYEVWRAGSDPYFLPAAACAAPDCTLNATTSYTHTGALSAQGSLYYAVRSCRNCGTRSTPTGRVGEFSYSLLTGLP